MKLYGYKPCAPCRSVAMCLEYLGGKYIFEEVDITAGEQMKADFLKMNPQHTVPTLDDQGFYLHESRAILRYLANQHGADRDLYPTEPKERAQVDRMLCFDMGTLYQKFGDYVYPTMFRGVPLDDEKKQKFVEGIIYLEMYLGEKHFVCGDRITIADFAILSTVTTFKACGYDVSDHPNVEAWVERCCHIIPNYQSVNQAGAEQFAQWMKSKTSLKLF